MRISKPRPLLRLALLAALAGLAARPASAQKAIFVVRHAEKISEEDERLTDAGRSRAGRLAEMLKNAGISAIYSTQTDRTIGTAQPLANALGLKIRIYDTAPANGNADFQRLVERLRSEVATDGIVLVVGHSNTVPLILKSLGCADVVTIASDEYDNLFVVVPKAGSAATLLRLRY
jgi:broad specificity phosphatase PhoE